MSNLVRNERTKLVANALDRASTACVAVGILAPVAATLAGTGSALRAPAFIAPFSGWILAALALHFVARRILGRLVE
jgi:hypothetical protein